MNAPNITSPITSLAGPQLPVDWTGLPSPLLVVGAAHSGKSQFALSLLSTTPKTIVIGTADPGEPAFESRLRELKSQRPAHWQLVEVPPTDAHKLPKDLGNTFAAGAEQVLLDSINQWIAGMLVTDLGKYSMPQIEQRLDTEFYTLRETIARPRPSRLVMVTSETGAGTVPPAPVERFFRQSTGRLNCMLAEASATVILMCAGIPVIIKSTPQTGIR